MTKPTKKSFIYFAMLIFLSVCLLMLPLQGLTISSLNLEIKPDTDVIFSFKYIATPAEQKLINIYKPDILTNLSDQGIVPSSGKSENSFIVPNYSSKTTINGKTAYILPGFYYHDMAAIDGLQKDIEAIKIITGNNLTPKITTIKWPDGTSLHLPPLGYVPNLYHIIENPVNTTKTEVIKTVLIKNVTSKPGK